MFTTKEAEIVRTYIPSVGHVVHVETWDARGRNRFAQTRPMTAVRSVAAVAWHRVELERLGYEVEVTDREASAA